MSPSEKKGTSFKQEDIADRVRNIINKEFKTELEDIVQSLTDRITLEVLKENANARDENSKFLCTNNNYHEYRKGHQDNKGKVSEKIFLPRDSLLTELLEIPHMRAIYNIMIVILILLFLNAAIYDLVDTGSINLRLRLIITGFGKINIVAIIWILMEIGAFFPYVLLQFWAKYRPNDKTKKYQLFDILILCLVIIYHSLLLIIPIYFTIEQDLPIPCALIVLFEMVRFMMKSHAFIREISPRIINSKSSTNILLPDFSWYLYFLFAPTLVYRDSYPRTKKMQFKKVLTGLMEIAAVVFYMNFVCDRVLIDYWSKFGTPSEVLEAKTMVLTLFATIIPTFLLFLCGFYLLLHSWHNVFAELLTFADRRFYSDWWNQRDYGGFYRTWNAIVHDWLYTYIYKDFIMLSGKRSIGTFFVFLISSIFHEVILTFAFGFFYPALLIMFGVFGVIFFFITKYLDQKFGNIFMWFTIILGNGLLWCMYTAEFFARVNCPMTIENKYIDLMVPRSWFCHQIVLSPDWKLQPPFQ